MRRELAERVRAGPGLFATVPEAWRPALGVFALGWASNFMLFLPDWSAMADQWWNISTYNHVLLVPAIVAWLLFERLPQLKRVEPMGWWPGLVLAGGASFLWVLGEFAGLSLVRQLAVVALLAATALALLGPRACSVLAFPLAYMIFLVPFGDELVPPLQMITAALTIGLVHLSGIQATIDGVFIQTPAGLFEVAEACSGVKFLIAMAAFGVLTAGVCFSSWRRRIAFLAVCLVVPVLANGLRAWGTIFAAQFIGAERASGFDHIVYGWLFFAIVIMLVLAISWPFFDRPRTGCESIPASSRLRRLEALRIGAAPALLALLATVIVGQVWARAADTLASPLPAVIALPDVPGWQRVHYAPQVAWEPLAAMADHRLLGRYADADGREVDVFVAVYESQGEGREPGGFGQGAQPSGGAWAWQGPGPDLTGARSDRLFAKGHVNRLAYTWYRTGKLTTGSNVRLKLAGMADRLLLRTRPTTMLIVSAEAQEGVPAEAAVHAFLRAIGPPDAWMDRIAGIR